MAGSREFLAEGFLTAQEDLQTRAFLESRAHKEPQIGERLRRKEVGLIDQQDCGVVVRLDSLEDLEEETLLAAPGLLAQARDEESQDAVGTDVAQRHVDRIVEIATE